jgi:hypothetical protein
MLRENDYCNKDKGIDYVPCEVDQLYFGRMNKISDIKNRQQAKLLEAWEVQKYKDRKEKWCAKCKNDFPWNHFHKDKSKKQFGLRSHCMTCRKEK